MEFIEIAPGYGFAAIPFGADRDSVRQTIGDPDEVVHSEPDLASEVWVYHALATAFHFAADQDLRFVSCETFSKQITLDGEPLIGLDRREAEALLLRLDAGPPEWMDREADGAGPLALPAAGLTLWFDEGLVQSIGWSVFFDESDQVVWPEEPAV
jgi:hypothetical protein